MSFRSVFLCSILAIGAAAPLAAETVDDDTLKLSPKPRFEVVDGGTVKFGRQFVRLFGIEGPEKGQTCDDGWQPAPLAKKALQEFIAGRPVNCRQVSQDRRTGRPAAQCFADHEDLQAMMVLGGWAWANTDRYRPEEQDAVSRKAGVHGHPCVRPAAWRAQRRKQSP